MASPSSKKDAQGRVPPVVRATAMKTAGKETLTGVLVERKAGAVLVKELTPNSIFQGTPLQKGMEIVGINDIAFEADRPSAQQVSTMMAHAPAGILTIWARELDSERRAWIASEEQVRADAVALAEPQPRVMVMAREGKTIKWDEAVRYSCDSATSRRQEGNPDLHFDSELFSIHYPDEPDHAVGYTWVCCAHSCDCLFLCAFPFCCCCNCLCGWFRKDGYYHCCESEGPDTPACAPASCEGGLCYLVNVDHERDTLACFFGDAHAFYCYKVGGTEEDHGSD